MLDSPESKTSISFSAGNAESSLVANPGGSVSIISEDGVEIAGINTPWAVDSQGAELATNYTIDGNTITQHIDTTEATFPVTADPTICGNKIRRVTFSFYGRSHRMNVLPTRCGRWWNGYSGWREAKREGGVRYNQYQNQVMWKQYRCHFDFAPYNRVWNLESWRPNVSWARVHWQRCNPTRR